MKKRVKFAENQMVHRLHHDELLPGSCGMNRSEMAELNHAGWKMNRPRAAGNKAQLQHLMIIQIPKAMTAAPFLKHAALTPAQKQYLYSIAASCSPAHVRSIIAQHYMNVLHRSVPSGQSPDRDGLFIPSAPSAEHENENHQPTASSEHLSRSKLRGRNQAKAKYSGKSIRKNATNRKPRSANASASKRKKMKKQASASQALNRKNPKGSGIMLKKKKKKEDGGEEEEEEEGPDDSLSECLSSLSLEEWDDDNFSDL